MTETRTTAQRFDDAQRFAERHQRPLLDVLEQAGMLVTPAHDKRVKVAVLAELWSALHTMDASGLLQAKYQRSHGTPRELMLALLDMLDDFGSEVQEDRR